MTAAGMVMVLSLVVGTVLPAQEPARTPSPGREPRMAYQERERARDMALEAERHAAEDPLERYLFPPELIMRRQRDIGLQPAQRQQITQAIQRLEASLVELQWTMQEQQQALAEMLAQPQVDTAAALRVLDRVLTTEATVKRVHFQALLTIRNVLTAEQQERLRGWPREPGRDEERQEN